jgi:hypothetical protein
MSDPILYHYTCDHSAEQIGPDGCLLPLRSRPEGQGLSPFHTSFVWMTDLDHPVRDALGLTSHILTCDRTRFRYRVIAGQYGVGPWMRARRSCTAEIVEELESAPGAMPAHWWVSSYPVAVVYDPIGGAA